MWDIDKTLTLSTYGSPEKAKLYGGFYTHNDGPAAAIAIQEKSTKAVLVENLSFEMWEEGAIILEETEDVTIRNIVIDKTGTYYFTDENDRDAFMQAPIYPQATKYIKTQKDPFAALFSEMRSAINSGGQNVLITCGYSFNDEHINSEIEHCLNDVNNKTTVVAFTDEKPEGEVVVNKTLDRCYGQR